MNATDYQMLPEGPPWPQLLGGVLVQDPAPYLDHQTIAGNVFLALETHTRAQASGRVILAPFDVYLSEMDVFQPDVLFLAAARLHRLRRNGVFGAPDLAVEVVTPATAKRDRWYKLPVYRDAGTADYWLIDPAGTVECHDFRAGTVRTTGPDGLLSAGCLPGFSLPARTLWRAV